MNLPATRCTAAFAGAFSAIAWVFISPLLKEESTSSTALLMAAILLLVAAPAHLLVVGVGQGKSFHERTLEPGFQLRLVCWLVAAVVTTGLAAVWK